MNLLNLGEGSAEIVDLPASNALNLNKEELLSSQRCQVMYDAFLPKHDRFQRGVLQHSLYYISLSVQHS